MDRVSRAGHPNIRRVGRNHCSFIALENSKSTRDDDKRRVEDGKGETDFGQSYRRWSLRLCDCG